MTENEKQLKETEVVLMRLYQKGEITIEAFTILNDRNKQAINYTRCSTQLKDKEVMTFESWVVENKETETYNAFLEGGFSFSLGDLYRKYAESLNKPLIV
jgi:hypothetical protein